VKAASVAGVVFSVSVASVKSTSTAAPFEPAIVTVPNCAPTPRFASVVVASLFPAAIVDAVPA
jgi:hypothetical protein